VLNRLSDQNDPTQSQQTGDCLYADCEKIPMTPNSQLLSLINTVLSMAKNSVIPNKLKILFFA